MTDDPTDEHWIITLYERYAKLYGDPIEQPSKPREKEADEHEPHVDP